MIIVRELSLEAGARHLVSDANFTLQAGDRVGLVGRNGAGKTTLLRVLAGRAVPAGGSILRSGTLGYFSQEAALPDFERPDMTGLERILSSRKIGAMQRKGNELLEKLDGLDGEPRDRAIRSFSRLQDEFEAKGGYAAESEAKRTAAALGLDQETLERSVESMSGGERRRVELARILFSDAETLLLDEPTNHLDLDAKAWLMGFRC